MSTEPTTPQQDERPDVEASRTTVREVRYLARIDLPPIPTFTRPLVPADELPVQRPLRDAPAAAWQTPFPTPEPTNHYSFQADLPPPQDPHAPPTPAVTAPPIAPPITQSPHGIPRSAHATFCAMPTAAPAPAPAPTFSGVPALAVAPATATATAAATAPHHALDVDDAATDAPTDGSTTALGLLLVIAALLVWASRMAFSPALLTMSALLLTELGIALSLTGPKRPTSAAVAVGAGTVLALLALKGALAGLGQTAFVASLLVLVAALTMLLLLGATEFVLRTRSSASPANVALRAGSMTRFGAALALLVSGFVARDSYSAKPDTFAAFVIIALVAFGVAQVLRGTGRAARA